VQISRFVLINLLIVICLVLFMFRGRRRPRPSQFDLAGNRRLDQNPNRPREKVLNCFFEFQGASYDAYEVLGVPAGATDEFILEGYRAVLARSTSAEAKAKTVAAYEALKVRR
jgi:hypothetical protein